MHISRGTQLNMRTRMGNNFFEQLIVLQVRLIRQQLIGCVELAIDFLPSRSSIRAQLCSLAADSDSAVPLFIGAPFLCCSSACQPRSVLPFLHCAFIERAIVGVPSCFCLLPANHGIATKDPRTID